MYIKKIIDSVESGDNVAASDAFAAAMVDKQMIKQEQNN